MDSAAPTPLIPLSRVRNTQRKNCVHVCARPCTCVCGHGWSLRGLSRLPVMITLPAWLSYDSLKAHTSLYTQNTLTLHSNTHNSTWKFWCTKFKQIMLGFLLSLMLHQFMCLVFFRWHHTANWNNHKLKESSDKVKCKWWKPCCIVLHCIQNIHSYPLLTGMIRITVVT